MTIDLKYLIPFALPFAIIFTIRALCFVAGADWAVASGFVVFISTVVGSIIGLCIVVDLLFRGVTWPLRIGGKK